jgi:hypothetical protein
MCISAEKGLKINAAKCIENFEWFFGYKAFLSQITLINNWLFNIPLPPLAET